MKLGKRHIGLLAGMSSVIISSLFVGKQQDTYHILLLAGLLLSAVCYLLILLGKAPVRSKLLWTGIVAAGIVLNGWTNDHLIETSYRIYLHQHEQELNEVNSILLQQSGEVWIMRDSVSVKSGTPLSPEEKQRLQVNQDKLGLYLILKSDSTIYYELWGFLDVRLGLTYAIKSPPKHIPFRHLEGNWFH